MIVTAKGSIGVSARREAVWAALHDVERVALCVPGGRSVVRDGGDSYLVTASVRLGPVRVAFDGVVQIADCEAPTRLALTGHGRGGLAGTASGAAMIRITERANGCRMSYELEAHADGPIAQLGPTALTALAATLCKVFGRRFARLFEVEEPSRRATKWLSRGSGGTTISSSTAALRTGCGALARHLRP